MLGRNTAGIWQDVPTVVSWVQGPLAQNLTTDFPPTKVINIDNQNAGAAVTTRSFLVGTPTSSITCSGCLVSNDGISFVSMLTGLASTDKVQFRVTAVAPGTTKTASFVFNSVPYTLNVKSKPASCLVVPSRRGNVLNSRYYWRQYGWYYGWN